MSEGNINFTSINHYMINNRKQIKNTLQRKISLIPFSLEAGTFTPALVRLPYLTTEASTKVKI